MGLFAELRERRLFRIVAGYVAGGWVVLSGIDQFADRGVIPNYIYVAGLVWFVAGFFAALTIGWYHGEKGRQKAPAREIGILSILALGALLVSGSVVRSNLIETPVVEGLDPNTIAVLYFQDASPDQSLAAIADGLTEGLIEEFSTVPSLSVVSRNGSERVREAELDYYEAARLLGAGTLVHGSVTRSRDEVRVDLSLIDGSGGSVFERATVSGAESELLDFQTTLATETARLVRELLGQEVELRRSTASTESVPAWSAYQRAERARKEAEQAVEDDDVDRAVARYAALDTEARQAEDLDPTWVDPVVLRGWGDYRLARLEGDPLDVDEGLQRAIAHADRALGMESGNPEALELRGTALFTRWAYNLEPDPGAAEALLQRAKEDLTQATSRDRRMAYAWNVLSVINATEDDLVTANMSARRAYEADAYLAQAEDVLWRLWTTAYDLEISVQTEQWCTEGRRRFPGNPRFYECELFNMSTRTGHPDVPRAWGLVEDVTNRTPEHEREAARLRSVTMVAAVLARAQQPDSARAVLERSRGDRVIDPTGDILFHQAFVRVLLGDENEAIDLLAEFLAVNPARREGFQEVSTWWWRPLEDNQDYRRLVGMT